MTPAVNRALGLAAVVAATVRLVDWWHGTELSWPVWAYATGLVCGLILAFTPDRPKALSDTAITKAVNDQASEMLKQMYLASATLASFEAWVRSIDMDGGAKLMAEWLGYDWETLPEGRAVDRGMKPWAQHGIDSMHFTGGKDDIRDALRDIFNRCFPVRP